MARATELAPAQRRALAQLSRLRALRGFYLAGGTAIAFHLSHRRSNDLDLFSQDSRVDLDALAEEVAELPRSVVVSATDTALKIRVGGVPVDVVRYPYAPLRKPAAGPEGFPVAGMLDLATMKLAAIAKRGIRRDFWDLHEIVTRTPITLNRALDAYVTRFGVKKADLYHVLRSLAYFDDAENGPMPRGLTAARWRRIKEYFSTKAPEALARMLSRRRG